MRNFSSQYLPFSLLIISMLLTSCVSQILKEPKPVFSKEIILPQMNSDFVFLDKNIYPAWKNTKNNNVISVVSDCQDSHLDLIYVHNLLSDSLESSRLIEEKKTKINQKPAYYKKIIGELESKNIEIQSYSLINNSCVYLISLSGKPNLINESQKEFLKFMKDIDFKK